MYKYTEVASLKSHNKALIYIKYQIYYKLQILPTLSEHKQNYYNYRELGVGSRLREIKVFK